MKLSSAIGGGISGAVALTLIHETVRRLRPDAPRMDFLGMEALSKSLKSVDASVPERDSLFKITMAGDLFSNSIYYSLAGMGQKKYAILRGTIIGAAAGLGAVYLPEPLGLNTAPANRTPQTKVMTVALYLIGGIVAGLTSKLLNNKKL